MGKKRYFTKDATNGKSKKKRSDTNVDIGRADPESNDYYFDEVDQFHHDKDKVYLDRARRKDPGRVEEEVYPIRSDEDESDQDESAAIDQDDDDMKSDIDDEQDEEGYLPSADAWGKRRKVYYSTDFAGDEYAGLSGSDIEVAELEEQEAITLQKRLVQQMTEDDFKLDTAQATAPRKVADQKSTKNVVEVDLSALTEEEKLELLQQQSPELLSLIDEYLNKSKYVKKLTPIVNAILKYEEDNPDPNGKLPLFELIMKKYELCQNYLINLKFYFVLKATRQSVDNHPVIDRIMSLKKLVDEMDRTYEQLDPSVKRLSKILKSASSLGDLVDLINIPIRGKQKPQIDTKAKKVHWNLDDQSMESADQEGLEDDQEAEAIGKRGVTYEIEKNKGLTPTRKKEQRNPRVKNRMRFKKAVHRKKSQGPEARKELHRYGGEIRGIKPNVIRSIKLH